MWDGAINLTGCLISFTQFSHFIFVVLEYIYLYITFVNVKSK